MIFQSFFLFFCLINATVHLFRKHSMSLNCFAPTLQVTYSILHCLHLFFFFSNLCSVISQLLLRKHLPPLCYVMSGQELKLVTDNLNNWAFVCVSFISAMMPYVFPQSTELGAQLGLYLFWADKSLNFS